MRVYVSPVSIGLGQAVRETKQKSQNPTLNGDTFKGASAVVQSNVMFSSAERIFLDTFFKIKNEAKQAMSLQKVRKFMGELDAQSKLHGANPYNWLK